MFANIRFAQARNYESGHQNEPQIGVQSAIIVESKAENIEIKLNDDS